VTGDSADPLVFTPARQLVARLQSRELSAVEVMRAFLAQIQRVNPHVNAIVTLRAASELLAEAAWADRRLAAGERPGALHGLPIAIKDLSLTRGLRTTFGSLVYRDFVPSTDELYVERIRRAGAIVIGKTNTPEFGAGSQTFNAVFGPTRNPYDVTKTCGGSSGGAAVALACGMLPLADGTDLGGSLRNPASFCNVVGFRPSPGRVARLNAQPGDTLGVHGPMARTVDDLELLLSVMAGPDARDPASRRNISPPCARPPSSARRVWAEPSKARPTSASSRGPSRRASIASRSPPRARRRSCCRRCSCPWPPRRAPAGSKSPEAPTCRGAPPSTIWPATGFP